MSVAGPSLSTDPVRSSKPPIAIVAIAAHVGPVTMDHADLRKV